MQVSNACTHTGAQAISDRRAISDNQWPAAGRRGRRAAALLRFASRSGEGRKQDRGSENGTAPRTVRRQPASRPWPRRRAGRKIADSGNPGRPSWAPIQGDRRRQPAGRQLQGASSACAPAAAPGASKVATDSPDPPPARARRSDSDKRLFRNGSGCGSRAGGRVAHWGAGSSERRRPRRLGQPTAAGAPRAKQGARRPGGRSLYAGGLTRTDAFAPDSEARLRTPGSAGAGPGA